MSATMQRILVPLDGSSLAEQALPTAVALARRAKAKLQLVLVHVPNVMMEPGPGYADAELAMQNADRDYLRSVAGRLSGELGRDVSWDITQGMTVAQTLSLYVKELPADLVIMTTHGRGGVSRAWLGSVTDQVIRSSETPVLVIRPGKTETPAPERGLIEIMVCLDGSPLAEAALEPAVALARLTEAEISLVQVIEPVMLTSGAHLTFPSGYSELATAVQREAAQDYIRDLAERLRESGVKASGIAVIGTPVAETIIDLAAPKRVDLLVVATHGRGGIKRLVLGSVADKLVRGARVPVLVVRPGGPRTGSEAQTQVPASAHAAV